jgi:hypothetical protein
MKTFLALSLLILGGCVQARDPQLVAMNQTGDSMLTCDQIAVEYKANTEVAQSKIAKNQANDREELLFGILVWPGLFDLKNADGNEGNALLDRNILLMELAKAKTCPGTGTWPGQPARYTLNGYRMS